MDDASREIGEKAAAVEKADGADAARAATVPSVLGGAECFLFLLVCFGYVLKSLFFPGQGAAKSGIQRASEACERENTLLTLHSTKICPKHF